MSRRTPIEPIASRDNPRFKRLRRLVEDAAAYRREGVVWLEGDHLLRALLGSGQTPQAVVLTPAAAPLLAELQALGLPPSVAVWWLTPALMGQLSALACPVALGALARLPDAVDLDAALPTVVLDRVQDPGNVGSILRTAAAMGFAQVVALKGSAGLWSPKVVRAGMGAHFALRLLEGVERAALGALRVPLLATSSHAGTWLHQARLPWPCAWVFGHEGQGVDAALLQQASLRVRIAQPGGQESLNVAAAAAICLHASAVARLGAATPHASGMLRRSEPPL
ncbi:TrmH family RNA methyltransferase [Tepidimonas aquatica]|uniref:23S rRNA (Guanosine-2'-O-)-methyltransferase RlmB n=1 Tax=Tepidimonas aquatica TaxID=247482 RepID=A0A554WSK8_9BURK|nr:RNA methyltransferase [Tepidimonas aquatica]TSE26578.1 23S rRNA (guanosine-2'-O-)-methyltransferase RlmB [Tepidimonas aquatica]